MSRGRVILFAGTVVGAIVLGTFLFAVTQAYLDRRKAEQLLAVLQQIQVGSTDRARALQMVSPLRSHSEEWTDRGLPALDLSFDNRALAWLKLAPYTSFRASVVFKDGVVIKKHATEFVARSGYAASVTETKRALRFSGESAPSGYPNHIVHQNWTAPTVARQIVIEDDETYGEVQRRDDWKFNLSCLTRFSGCWGANMILPNIEPTTLAISRDAQ